VRACRGAAHARPSTCDECNERRCTIASRAAAGTEAPQARSAWAGELRAWLGSPLLVAIVGTLFASVLIPHWTRGWQDHQKALELESGLVASMSQSASDAVITARLLSARGPTQAEVERATRSWSVQSAVIGARLRAYFGPRVGDSWQVYADGVADYVQLDTAGGRAAKVAQLRALRLPRTAGVDWAVLVRGRAAAPVLYDRSYERLAFALLAFRDVLISSVLDSNPAGY
jgi:hypothetical protein